MIQHLRSRDLFEYTNTFMSLEMAPMKCWLLVLHPPEHGPIMVEDSLMDSRLVEGLAGDKDLVFNMTHSKGLRGTQQKVLFHIATLGSTKTKVRGPLGGSMRQGKVAIHLTIPYRLHWA